MAHGVFHASACTRSTCQKSEILQQIIGMIGESALCLGEHPDDDLGVSSSEGIVLTCGEYDSVHIGKGPFRQFNHQAYAVFGRCLVAV
jgi:hypothetical protein